MNVGKIPIKNEYFIAYIVVSYEMNKKKHFFFFCFMMENSTSSCSNNSYESCDTYYLEL